MALDDHRPRSRNGSLHRPNQTTREAVALRATIFRGRPDAGQQTRREIPCRRSCLVWAVRALLSQSACPFAIGITHCPGAISLFLFSHLVHVRAPVCSSTAAATQHTELSTRQRSERQHRIHRDTSHVATQSTELIHLSPLKYTRAVRARARTRHALPPSPPSFGCPAPSCG